MTPQRNTVFLINLTIEDQDKKNWQWNPDLKVECEAKLQKSVFMQSCFGKVWGSYRYN